MLHRNAFNSPRKFVVRVLCALDGDLLLTGATLGAETVRDHEEQSRIPGHFGRDSRISEGMVRRPFVQSGLQGKQLLQRAPESAVSAP